MHTMDKLWTYQEVMTRFACSYATARRWLRGQPRLGPTCRTVRFTQSQIDALNSHGKTKKKS